MAKKDNKNEIDDKIVFDTMPGADKKTEEDVEGFKVDMNFEDPKEEDDSEIAKEDEIEETEEQEPTPDTEEAEESEAEEGETEEVEAEPAVAESEGEETVLGDDEGDTQEPETGTEEPVNETKEPMIPKSRFDEVLQKQKALAKKLEEVTNPVEVFDKAPEYDFEAKEQEYQELILNGEPNEAVKLRTEIRNAEKKQMMFDVQNQMGHTVQQNAEMVALQAKAAELATSFPTLDENHASFDKEKTQEVLELRDAFMAQGYAGADALEKSAKYIMGEPESVSTEPKKDDVNKKIVQKKKVANTNKKLEAAESQPPALKGKNKVEKKVDLDVLSTEEFDALPEETLKRMRGDFG